eukprot:UN11204
MKRRRTNLHQHLLFHLILCRRFCFVLL